ncbi:hypothetical protein PR048_023074 [Dryococelus australis]|uniref:Uncharacterized protein n=1 Tax=Dryococelus australis TaxID=614101 RepID=A0ABQ9GT22_9NEOP|nr:hypothetical protein PR048_023074 [Dryococelus australis]
MLSRRESYHAAACGLFYEEVLADCPVFPSRRGGFSRETGRWLDWFSGLPRDRRDSSRINGPATQRVIVQRRNGVCSFACCLFDDIGINHSRQRGEEKSTNKISHKQDWPLVLWCVQCRSKLSFICIVYRIVDMETERVGLEQGWNRPWHVVKEPPPPQHRPKVFRKTEVRIAFDGNRSRVPPEYEPIGSPLRHLEVSVEQHRNERGGGNRRSARKPADQRYRPALFPHAKIPGANPLGIEPGSPWWEASSLTTTPLRHILLSCVLGRDREGWLALRATSGKVGRLRRAVKFALKMRCARDSYSTIFPRVTQRRVAAVIEPSFPLRAVSLLASHEVDPGSIPGRVTPDFRKWESWRTILLVGGFSRGSPVSPALSFWSYSIFTTITRIGSQDLDRNDENTACLARRDDVAPSARVSVTRIAPMPAHALDDFEPIADLQGNKKLIPYCQAWCNIGAAASEQPSEDRLTEECGV